MVSFLNATFVPQCIVLVVDTVHDESRHFSPVFVILLFSRQLLAFRIQYEVQGICPINSKILHIINGVGGADGLFCTSRPPKTLHVNQVKVNIKVTT